MFTGTYRHAVDAKGRLFIPVRLREELGETFMVTRGLQNCLRLYPMKEWEAFAAKIAALPETRAKDVRHYFFANAFDTSLDGQGRVTLPADCRKFASLEKNVVLVGDDTRLEIWDEERWDALDAENYGNILPVLEELGF
ncbi:MAG: division/cell wall cluster transcriptional repressor MraZ [Clostridia bacterium]|jgi:MraZ protein|nr:division/cell wall cluster transcriptional repressor MraZ [Clostridia bacterium]MBO7157641.1 division/cell wall cluster transcriptional repressor MraZ [Clostridia bacterium]MBQ2254173.1 division/cell wall cluster transcriptional repressor MraZ [Clostridia bacterium]MBQ5791442.1 division/cell wall cluster transcriptional repressor MraZ [Clostridia bacterium]MBR5264444.1 division/cell wall cluster transcriptional repressor MraZ [Clostridia bacterium]